MKKLIYTLMLAFVMVSCQTNNTPDYILVTQITNDRYGNIMLGVSDSAFSVSLSKRVPIQKDISVEIFDREGNKVDHRIVILHKTSWAYDCVWTSYGSYGGDLPSLPAGFYKIKIKATPIGDPLEYETYSVVTEEDFIVGFDGRVS